MRIFIALDIESAIRERLERFMDGLRNFAPDARWVSAESLHVTLKFIGEQTPEQASELKRLLGSLRAEPTTICFRGYGFFPSAKAPRVFWVGIEADPQLAALASSVDAATASLGIRREEHPFTPHLTLARGGSSRSPRGGRAGDSPRTRFKSVQEKLSNMSQPEFGTMTATEFFLYESRLSAAGARYIKLERFPLQLPGNLASAEDLQTDKN